MGTEGDIRNALINLVFNAIDVMRKSGTLAALTCEVRLKNRRRMRGCRC